jgi:hypothetical protein
MFTVNPDKVPPSKFTCPGWLPMKTSTRQCQRKKQLHEYAEAEKSI